MKVDLLVGPASEVVTVAGPSGPGVDPGTSLGLIPDGVVACRAGRIVAVGPAAEVARVAEPTTDCVRIPASGKVVTPGLVDSHTHFLFGGWRAEEFELRLAGAEYMEIMRRGGGILATVRATREASEEELLAEGLRRLDSFLACGTTTVEAKTGYGLDAPSELKCLRVLQELDRRHAVDVVPTFLGAHAVPPEFSGRTDAYVDFVAGEMIPRVAEEGLAEFVDVFCEEGVFSVEQCRRILGEGRRHGLRAKIHADEFAPSGGAELAAEVGAVSAEHLIQASQAGLKAMAEAGVIATVLPGVSLFLRLPRAAPAREMLELGLEVALASDCNPGSCTALSLPLVMSLGCLVTSLTPAEALIGCTRVAARSLGRLDRIGSIEPGKDADLVVFDAPSYQHLAYRLGENLVDKVIKKGRIALERGEGRG